MPSTMEVASLLERCSVFIVMLELRPYQKDLYDKIKNAIKKHKRILAFCPTGGGKSVIIGAIATSAASKGSKVIILSHRSPIISQNIDKIEKMGYSVSLINASTKGIPREGNICVASIQTLLSRIKRNNEYRRFISTFDLVLIDEAHVEHFTPVLDFINKNAYVCGFSATLLRSGQATQLGDQYEIIIEGESPSRLTFDGYLTNIKYYGFPAPKLDNVSVDYHSGDYSQKALQSIFQKKSRYKGIIENWKKYANGLQTAVFCTGVKHAIDICIEYTKIGISAAFVVSGEVDEEYKKYTGPKDEILRRFEDGEITVISSVYSLDVGWDFPALRCCVLDFSTLSYSRYIQAIGRVARPHPSKKYGIVIDMGDNTERHGFMTDPPKMSLFHKQGGGGVMQTKSCKGCERLIALPTVTCRWCGYTYLTEAQEHYIDLEELTRSNEANDFERWIAQKRLDGWSTQKIFCVAMAKNPTNKKQAFDECLKVLRNKHGSFIKPGYYHYLIKNVYGKGKYNKIKDK